MSQKPTLVSDLTVPDIMDPAGLIRLAYEGGDVSGVIYDHLDRAAQGTAGAADALNLGLLYQLVGQRDRALACQAQALAESRLFRVPARQAPELRLLAFVAQGDLMTNAPFELLLEGGAVDVVKFYVPPTGPLPAALPDHDVALVAISEADHTRDVLYRLHALLRDWPRPVLNRPLPIMELARDRLFRLLAGDDTLLAPLAARLPRDRLLAMALGRAPISEALAGADFPIIIRPTDSHAGEGLERMTTAGELTEYLTRHTTAEFHVAPFVDYHGPDDAHFRKYRIAFIGQQPHLCHMAVGDHWMVHYLNAGMADSDAKRQEEAAAMARFRTGFAQRHAAAFAELAGRIGLDYFLIDCAETPAGQLLIFEASTAMIVHALDSETLYPYKRPQMRQVFDAFTDLLFRTGKRP